MDNSRGNVVTYTDDESNRMRVFTISNPRMASLSDAREFICSEIENMKRLLGSNVNVTDIDGQRMEFKVGISNAILNIPGAYEWLSETIEIVRGKD